jgi:hypothetical protein
VPPANARSSPQAFRSQKSLNACVYGVTTSRWKSGSVRHWYLFVNSALGFQRGSAAYETWCRSTKPGAMMPCVCSTVAPRSLGFWRMTERMRPSSISTKPCSSGLSGVSTVPLRINGAAAGVVAVWALPVPAPSSAASSAHRSKHTFASRIDRPPVWSLERRMHCSKPRVAAHHPFG